VTVTGHTATTKSGKKRKFPFSRNYANCCKVDSKLFDDKGSISISKMLDACDRHQSDTKTHSERVLELDPKFNQVKATRIGLTAEQNPDVFALTTLSVKEESM